MGLGVFSWCLLCSIFRWLRRGILRFFCRRCFHGEIWKTIWPVFRIFQRNSKWSQKRPFLGIFYTPQVAKWHCSGGRRPSWEEWSNFRFLRCFKKVPGTLWILKFSDTQNSKSEFLGNLTHIQSLHFLVTPPLTTHKIIHKDVKY